MMETIRRRGFAGPPPPMGPDIAATPPPPPMEFLAVPQQGETAGPDLGPLAQALQQRLAQNASPMSQMTDAPMRRKIPMADMMQMAGGHANA